MRRRLLVAIVTPALLGVPAAASAQSPGDNQYQDPFPGGSTTTQPTTTPPPPTTTPAPPSSSGTGSSSSAPATTTQPTATTASTSSQRLPYTGFPAWLMAALGAAFLAGGIALRRTTAR